MNHRILALSTLLCTSTLLFGCKVNFINDTEFTVFAYDDGAQEGNIIEPTKQAFYGASERHSMVTLYMQVTPTDATFKRSYKVDQKACAIFAEDKIIRISDVIKDAVNKDIYTVTNFATGMDTLTCCGHHGSSMNHDAMPAEPTIDMDQE